MQHLAMLHNKTDKQIKSQTKTPALTISPVTLQFEIKVLQQNIICFYGGLFITSKKFWST